MTARQSGRSLRSGPINQLAILSMKPASPEVRYRAAPSALRRAVGANGHFHRHVAQRGIARAQALFHPLGGDLVRADQRNDETVVAGAYAPEMEIGHARAHLPLHHFADAARQSGVSFGVEQHQARIADEPEGPGS